jgi:NAD(P)H-flavin reductase
MPLEATLPPLAGGDLQPYAPLPFRVTGQYQETPDTTTLTLEAKDGAPLAPFRPGQFNMLYAPRVGEVAISIAGDPRDPRRLVHTVRSAGKITRALTRVKVGQTVGVRGPYGSGWPVIEGRGRDLLLVAGGLGLPPLRPVLYQALARREDFRRVEVIYGARTPKDLVYYDEIQRWRSRGDLRFQVTVDAAGMDWYGDVGIVTQRLPDTRFEPANTVAFLCGPEIMMKATARALMERGMSPDRIWVSMERNMKCGIAQCGHCQFGPFLLCRDGPVLPYAAIERLLSIREL